MTLIVMAVMAVLAGGFAVYAAFALMPPDYDPVWS